MAFPAEIAAPNFGAPGFGAPDFDALLLALLHPNFDPVAFSVWIFDVRWYALAYIAGLLLAWAYCRWVEIGRASCRARVCKDVSISGVAGALKKKTELNKTVEYERE